MKLNFDTQSAARMNAFQDVGNSYNSMTAKALRALQWLPARAKQPGHTGLKVLAHKVLFNVGASLHATRPTSYAAF
jgi:hypothetical protein